jgi:hypothetical protein
MRWLFDWQHVTPGNGVVGEHGTFEVHPAAARLRGAGQCLGTTDCSRGAFRHTTRAELDRSVSPAWSAGDGLSPHPATLESTESPARRVMPTSVAPITFFVRERRGLDGRRRDAPGAVPAGLSRNARACTTISSARRVVLSRHRARRRTPQGGDRGGIVEWSPPGSSPPTASTTCDRSSIRAAARAGLRPHGASASQRRPVGAAPNGRRCSASGGHRLSVSDAAGDATAVVFREVLTRESKPAAVARPAHRAAAHGRSRRRARRALCRA